MRMFMEYPKNNKLFAEALYTFTVHYTNGRTIQVPGATWQAYQYWRKLAETTPSIKRIYGLRRITEQQRWEINAQNNARAGRRKIRTWRVGDYLRTEWSDGTFTQIYSPQQTTPPVTTPPVTPPPQGPPNPNPGGTAHEIASQINDQTGAGDTVQQAKQDLTEVNAELRKIWKNIEEKKRAYEADKKFAGDQRVALGAAIDDAWGGIGGNTEWLTNLQKQLDEMNERVSKQLKDLGKASVDISEALAALQLAQQAKQLAASAEQAVGGGALGSISDFFGKPTNIMLVGAALILVLILVKR